MDCFRKIWLLILLEMCFLFASHFLMCVFHAKEMHLLDILTNTLIKCDLKFLNDVWGAPYILYALNFAIFFIKYPSHLHEFSCIYQRLYISGGLIQAQNVNKGRGPPVRSEAMSEKGPVIFTRVKSLVKASPHLKAPSKQKTIKQCNPIGMHI